jgi:hypothetical protein
LACNIGIEGLAATEGREEEGRRKRGTEEGEKKI